MLSAIGTVLLVFSLVLGGSGATVAAAQQSMPDEGLYPVKTWSEDLRISLTDNEEARFQLALEFAGRRAAEMQDMLSAGAVLPATLQARLQSEIDLALQLAAGQTGPDMVQSLSQIRTQLQEQQQTFLMLGFPVDPQNAAILDQTRTLLQDRLRLCDDGLRDPTALREYIQDRDRTRLSAPTAAPGTVSSPVQSGNPWVTGTTTPGTGYGPGSGDGTGNPWTDETPVPGSGYGPGEGDGDGVCDGCDGEGENNPWTDEVPTPNSGYGPGSPPEDPEPGNGDGGGSGGGSGGGNGSGSGKTD